MDLEDLGTSHQPRGLNDTFDSTYSLFCCSFWSYDSSERRTQILAGMMITPLHQAAGTIIGIPVFFITVTWAYLAHDRGVVIPWAYGYWLFMTLMMSRHSLNQKVNLLNYDTLLCSRALVTFGCSGRYPVGGRCPATPRHTDRARIIVQPWGGEGQWQCSASDM